MRGALVALLTSGATFVAAEVPFLALPIACTPGADCVIEDYPDADPGPGALDHACGLKTRDGHNGTDFALPDIASMVRGVTVRAAAPGTVAAIRDGVEDRPLIAPDDVAGRECGNAVRIAHDNGYHTLYCHLARGSLSVRPGDRVSAGEKLGRVGMSGLTNFPHLHFTLLRDGTPVDPFAPDAPICAAEPTRSLWLEPAEYEPSGLFTAAFSTGVPDLAAVQSGAARATEAARIDPLVLYGFTFHARSGDVLEFLASGPDGTTFEHSAMIEAGQAQLFRAFGRRAPAGGWPPGAYRGTVRLTRDGVLLAVRHAELTIAP